VTVLGNTRSLLLLLLLLISITIASVLFKHGTSGSLTTKKIGALIWKQIKITVHISLRHYNIAGIVHAYFRRK
jgi:phage-related holin